MTSGQCLQSIWPLCWHLSPVLLLKRPRPSNSVLVWWFGEHLPQMTATHCRSDCTSIFPATLGRLTIICLSEAYSIVFWQGRTGLCGVSAWLPCTSTSNVRCWSVRVYRLSCCKSLSLTASATVTIQPDATATTLTHTTVHTQAQVLSSCFPYGRVTKFMLNPQLCMHFCCVGAESAKGHGAVTCIGTF